MNDRSQIIDVNSIIRILPHKPPATLIDRVIEVEPGQRILTTKNMTLGESCFQGHFPGFPMLPASVFLEIMSQSCCLLAYATDHFNPATKIITLIGVNNAKFNRTIQPGDVLEIEATLSQKRSNVWRFAVEAFRQDRSVAEAKLVLSILERDDAL